MKHIIEVANFVTKNRLKKIDMLSQKGAKGENRYLEVANSLATGSITTSAEMAHLIRLEERSNNFRVFKMRLFDKLLNSLLFLDLDERKFSIYSKAISECYRNSFCIRILLILK